MRDEQRDEWARHVALNDQINAAMGEPGVYEPLIELQAASARLMQRMVDVGIPPELVPGIITSNIVTALVKAPGG